MKYTYSDFPTTLIQVLIPYVCNSLCLSFQHILFWNVTEQKATAMVLSHYTTGVTLVVILLYVLEVDFASGML